MDDPLLMGGFQGFGDLLGDRQCLVNRDWPLRDSLRQRWPFDQFQNQRLLPFGFFQPVDVADVGMVQGGQDFGFALEPGQPCRDRR